MFEIEPAKAVIAFRCISFLVAAWFFYKLFIKPLLSPLRKIPGCAFCPIIGNMLEILRSGDDNNAVRWMQKYKSRIIRYYYFGGEGRVIVADPALVKHILVNNSQNYLRSPSGRNARGADFFAFTNGKKHHAIRRLFSPMFTTHAVEGYIPAFNEIGLKLVKIWSGILKDGDRNGLINAQDYMTRLSLDTISLCGFGYELNSLENDDSVEVKSFQYIVEGFERSYFRILQTVLMHWLPAKCNLRNRAAWKVFTSTVHKMISIKQEKMHKGNAGNDILSTLLQVSDENGRHLNKEEICNQVHGFLFAGYETTSTTLTWILLEMAQHPDVQEKARQEVLSLMFNNDKPIDAKQMEGLSYLTAVIKESQRCHSVVSIVFKKSLRDDYLQSYHIPAGTHVGIHYGAMHRLPELWPDPSTFKPERFLQYYDKCSFLPFSKGPYMCIGNIFSMTQIKIILSLILSNFRFSLPAGFKWKTVRGLSVHPKPPLQLVVTPLRQRDS